MKQFICPQYMVEPQNVEGGAESRRQKIDGLVKGRKLPFSSFRRRPEFSDHKMFWTPARVPSGYSPV